MRPETLDRQDGRRHAAARAAADANTNTKRTAYWNGVTVRTAQRWASPTEAAGSPAEVWARYVATSEDPERLEVFAEVTKEQRRIRKLTNAELVEQIRTLMAEDPRTEAADNVAKVSRGISLTERALISERDATIDMKLAARFREAAARGLRESDVLDQWSPR
ncbi:MAG: hypothetical protein ABL993_02525 [Vicinamibacterales bacterium]